MTLTLLLLLHAAAEIATPGVVYQQPQLAQGPGLIAVAFGAGSKILVATSGDGAKTFGAPVLVTSDPNQPMLGRHRGPRVSITPKAVVVTAPRGGELMAWRSMDRGKTWSTGVRVNDVPGSAREGLHGTTSLPDGTLASTWLDMREKGMRLYAATSRDHGATWTKNVQVYASPDGHICECCHPSILADGQGHLHVMFRNWLGGARDLYLATSIDGGRSFAAASKLGDGTWALNACPMDGGGLVADDGGALVTAWRRDKTIFYASPGRTERALSEGKDPAIGISGRDVWISWTQAGSVHFWTATSLETKLVGPGGYPQLLGSLLAYENAGVIVIRDLK